MTTEDYLSVGDAFCCLRNVYNDQQIDCDSIGVFSLEEESVKGFMVFVFIGISICLVLLGGCMSGLTIGLLSLDPVNLEILQKSGDDKSKKYAKGISPLIKRHHLLLATLLMANAAAMESLPIFLDRIVSPLIAILISVTAVLIFGEIVPQAICSRFGLSVGYYLRYFVWTVIGVFFIIAYPISLILDSIFGHNRGTYYRRAELKELVAIHEADEEDGGGGGEGEERESGVGSEQRLTRDEITIIKGALDMSKKTVSMAMTPIARAFMLEFNDRLDYGMMKRIVEAGHSRVPIFHISRQNVIGMILVKNLILLDPNDCALVSSQHLRRLPMVPATLPLYDMLNIFQMARSHMAIVLDPLDHLTILGVITLEDVIEELIQEEIVDETDVYVDVVKQIRVAQKRTGDIVPFSSSFKEGLLLQKGEKEERERGGGVVSMWSRAGAQGVSLRSGKSFVRSDSVSSHGPKSSFSTAPLLGDIPLSLLHSHEGTSSSSSSHSSPPLSRPSFVSSLSHPTPHSASPFSSSPSYQTEFRKSSFLSTPVQKPTSTLSRVFPSVQEEADEGTPLFH